MPDPEARRIVRAETRQWVHCASVRAVKEFVRSFVPAKSKVFIRRCKYQLLDWVDLLSRRRDPLTPPRSLIFIGGDNRNFKPLGEKWLQTFIQIGGLQPHDRVLDVGCGVGRMAVPLTGYLDPGSSYEGLDIVEDGIRWCEQAITPRFPRFRFQRADVYNRCYNPDGQFKASEYRLPYSDNDFDFVFLTSVFTHMLPPDVGNYLREVHRVMRPGGRCLITFFLLNEESLERMRRDEAQADRGFRHDIGGGCLATDPGSAEVAIAYPEDVVTKLFDRCGFRITGLHHGGWCGKQGARHGQDIVVARKANA